MVQKAKDAPSIIGRDLVKEVTCAKPYDWTEGSGQWKVGLGGASRVPVAPEHATGGGAPSHQMGAEGASRFRVVAFDYGIKYNILRRLVQILLGKKPIFGICLGHQIMGLAMGLQTYKLKFGHHGANHPVMDMETRKVEITSQNHNFAVRGGEGTTSWATSHGRVQLTHVSLNDDAVEGLRCLDLPAYSVQYHPEASPGPRWPSRRLDSSSPGASPSLCSLRCSRSVRRRSRARPPRKS